MSTGERFQIESLERRRLLTGAIEGVVFNDLNGNATRDASEGVWPGITVWLDTNRNRAQDVGEPSAVTDAIGTYRFEGLAAGEYSVRMVEPEGWRQTTAAAGRTSFAELSLGRFTVGVELAPSLASVLSHARPWTYPQLSSSFTGVGIARSESSIWAFARGQAPQLFEIDPLRGTQRRSVSMSTALGTSVDVAWMNDALWLVDSVGRLWSYAPTSQQLTPIISSLWTTGVKGIAANPRSGELAVLSTTGIHFVASSAPSMRRTVPLPSGLPSASLLDGLAFSDGLLICARSVSSAMSEWVALSADTGEIVTSFPMTTQSHASLAGDGWTDTLVVVSDGAATTSNWGALMYAGMTQTTLARMQVSSQPAPASVEFLVEGIVPGSRVRVVSGSVDAPIERFVFDNVAGTSLMFSLPNSFSAQWLGIEQVREGRFPYLSEFVGVSATASNVDGFSSDLTRDNTPLIRFTAPVGDALLRDGRPIFQVPVGSSSQSSFQIVEPLADGTYQFSVGTVRPGYTRQRNRAMSLTVDTVAPFAASGVYERDRAIPRIVVQFSEAVLDAGLLVSVLSLVNLSTGQTVATSPPGGIRSMTVTPAEPLADGRYLVRWTNRSDLAGNVGDIEFTFHVLAGDANDDAVVNFDDLLVLAANYNQSPRVFSQGDFDRNGTVNFDDLLILASRYNTSISGTVGAPPPPSVLASGDDEDGAPNDVLR